MGPRPPNATAAGMKPANPIGLDPASATPSCRCRRPSRRHHSIGGLGQKIDFGGSGLRTRSVTPLSVPHYRPHYLSDTGAAIHFNPPGRAKTSGRTSPSIHLADALPGPSSCGGTVLGEWRDTPPGRVPRPSRGLSWWISPRTPLETTPTDRITWKMPESTSTIHSSNRRLDQLIPQGCSPPRTLRNANRAE